MSLVSGPGTPASIAQGHADSMGHNPSKEASPLPPVATAKQEPQDEEENEPEQDNDATGLCGDKVTMASKLESAKEVGWGLSTSRLVLTRSRPAFQLKNSSP